MALRDLTFGIKFQTDSKLFEQGMKKNASIAYNFFDSIEKQLGHLSNSFGISENNAQALGNTILNAMPKKIQELDDDHLAKKMVHAKMIDEIHNNLDQLSQSFATFFGDHLHKLGKDNKLIYKELNDAISNISSESLDSLASSMDNFINNTDKFSVDEIKNFTELLTDFKNAKSSEELEDIANQMERINKISENRIKIQKWTGDMSRFAKSVLGVYSLYQIFQEIIAIQNEMAQSVFQMGLQGTQAYTGISSVMMKLPGIGDNLKSNVRATTFEFLKMNRVVASKVNVSLSDAAGTMRELMSLRVGNIKGDLEDLSETSMLMQKALGMSAGSANRFIHSLSLVGDLGADEIQKAAQSLSDVGQNLGLTESEAQLVGDTVGKLMRQFRALGGSSKDISIITSEVAKMSVSFAKAGLAADDASALIQKMMDPENLSQSILLWQKMGMSAAEGISLIHGEGANMDNMSENMIRAAKDIKSAYGDNIWTLKAMAEAHGLSLEQVQALSMLTEKDIKLQRESVSIQKAANAARQGMVDQLRRIKDSIIIVLHGALVPLLQIINPLFEIIAVGMQKMNNGIEWLSQNVPVVGAMLSWLIRLVLAGGLLSVLGILPKVNLGFMGFFKNILGRIPVLGKAVNSIGSSFASVGKKVVGGFAEGVKKMNQAINSINVKNALAFGGMVAMIGGSVFLMSIGISKLVKSFQELTGKQIMGALGSVIIMFGGLAAMLALLGVVGASASIGLLIAAGALLAVGASVLMIGVGISKIVDSFANFFTVMDSSIASVTIGILSLSSSFFLLTLSMSSFTIGAGLMSVGVLSLVGSIMLLTTLTPILSFLGKSSIRLGESIMNIGVGMELISDNVSSVIEGLSLLKSEMKDGWNGIAKSMINELNKVQNVFDNMSNDTMVKYVKTFTDSTNNSGNDKKQGKNSRKSDDYLKISTTHLSTISSNTKETNKLLVDLIKITKNNKTNRERNLIANSA